MQIPRSELPTATPAAELPTATPRTYDEIVSGEKAQNDARMRAEIQRRFRRPKAQRMLKLAKKAQEKGDNEVAEMWVRRALK